MKVTLVLPGNDNFRSSAISQAGAEHLGLAYIAAFIRQKGHDVTIINLQVKYYLSYWEELEANQLENLNAGNASDEIIDSHPDLVGISVTGLTINETIAITNELKEKKPGLHICWGGHHAYQNAKDILEREYSVDTIVFGDGEITLSLLLEALKEGKNIGDIPGIWYRENNEVKFSGPPPEPDLDILPFPARDTLVDLVQLGTKVTDARISTSRGCTFDCTFCVDPSLGYRRKWRARSPEKVVKEIASLVEEFGVSFFWFSEDNFIPPTPAGRERAYKIAQLLIEQDLKIGYRALLRADAIENQPELLKKLAKSGLKCVYMGIESGAPRRLSYFKKHETPDQYRRVIRQLRELHIGLQVGFIMFDPLTTLEDLELDARFLFEIEEMYLYSNFCQVLDVFPGAEISRMLIDKGLLNPNFTYDSSVCDYRYEIPDIGKMALAVLSAYKDHLIELDKFFQRIRVVDWPQLWHLHAENEIPGIEEFENLFYLVLKKLNQAGLDFFFALLELSRSGWDETKFRQRLHAHTGSLVKEKDMFIEGIRKLPVDVKNNLSAASYFL